MQVVGAAGSAGTATGFYTILRKMHSNLNLHPQITQMIQIYFLSHAFSYSASWILYLASLQHPFPEACDAHPVPPVTHFQSPRVISRFLPRALAAFRCSAAVLLPRVDSARACAA